MHEQSASDWMIYGANGYTGRLIAEESVRRGMRPLLAGRRELPIEQLARRLECPGRVFSLDTPPELARQLAGCDLVLNCAGPFSATAEPLMDACLAAGAHYLDITGEIDCIEAAASRHERAVQAHVVLMPAVGFDVVPTDCLAARLAEALPSADHLQLAFKSTGRMSRGTMKTSVEGMAMGGRVRVDGRITRVPSAWKVRQIPFHDGDAWAMTIPWGDVASAWHSTGIPNIEVYMSMPRRQIRWIRRLRWLMPLAGLGVVQWWLSRRIDRMAEGPAAAERAAGGTSVWGRVSAATGTAVEATLATPEGYELTVQTALAIVDKLRAAPLAPGFYTPSRAYGSGLILEIPGVEFTLGAPS